jgi:2-methylcitrate dehydratase PrpD
MANILAGSRLKEGRQIAEFVKGLNSKEEATVFAFDYKASCRQASLANGTLGALLQSHDGYKYGGNHPCSAVMPACLSLAEMFQKRGEDLITAMVAGYEVSNRIAAAMHPSHSLKGFAPTGTAGTFGAAAAACKLLGCAPEVFTNAMGISGYLLPITTYETLLGKYSVTPLHGGFAAQVGIQAAMFARAGYSGCPDILRGAFGKGLFAMTAEDCDFSSLNRGLGEKFSILDVYLKPHPACRHTHAVLDVILEMIEQKGFTWQEVEKVEIKTYRMGMQFVQYTVTGSELYPCQMSLPYVVAVALMDGRMGVEQFNETRRQDPVLHDFSRKVVAVEDEELTATYPRLTPAEVKLELKDGTHLSNRCDLPKGDPENPMSHEELLVKVKSYTEPFLGPQKFDEFVTRIMGLEKEKDWAALVSWL